MTGLLLALRALDLEPGGEIVTTPFTFPATAHAIRWSGHEPVFCDIEPSSLNLDPSLLQAAIGPRTRAILPVHTFGRPCDVEAIAAVAAGHGLPVVYDAAHAFGVRRGGTSIATAGDLSVLSFHATKPFSTIEGGAVVCRDAAMRRRLELLANFGIAGEESVPEVGINGKLDELRAAYGLHALEAHADETKERAAVAAAYREALSGVEGIELPRPVAAADDNHAYVPVLVDGGRYGLDRDRLCSELRRFGVVARKYFHPLVSRLDAYRRLPSAAPGQLPAAEEMAARVLCLPIYGALGPEMARGVAAILDELGQLARSGR